MKWIFFVYVPGKIQNILARAAHAKTASFAPSCGAACIRGRARDQKKYDIAIAQRLPHRAITSRWRVMYYHHIALARDVLSSHRAGAQCIIITSRWRAMYYHHIALVITPAPGK
jgi:hypothetical protein